MWNTKCVFKGFCRCAVSWTWSDLESETRLETWLGLLFTDSKLEFTFVLRRLLTADLRLVLKLLTRIKTWLGFVSTGLRRNVCFEQTWDFDLTSDWTWPGLVLIKTSLDLILGSTNKLTKRDLDLPFFKTSDLVWQSHFWTNLSFDLDLCWLQT